VMCSNGAPTRPMRARTATVPGIYRRRWRITDPAAVSQTPDLSGTPSAVDSHTAVWYGLAYVPACRREPQLGGRNAGTDVNASTKEQLR
jgi:hypothetical protein